MHSFSSMQRGQFYEIIYFVCENPENIEMFAKDFIQHEYYGSMFTALFLHSF